VKKIVLLFILSAFLSCRKEEPNVLEGLWVSDDGGYQFVINRETDSDRYVYVIDSGSGFIFIAGERKEYFTIVTQSKEVLVIKNEAGTLITLKRH
jgi:hypothetical protein